MHKEKGSGRALGLDPFFRNGLYFLIFTCIFIFRILILYTTDFNPRINKDIIIIITGVCSEITCSIVSRFTESSYLNFIAIQLTGYHMMRDLGVGNLGTDY